MPGAGAVPQAAARSTELPRTGVWLVVSLASAAFGTAPGYLPRTGSCIRTPAELRLGTVAAGAASKQP
jgi:hypothetical protein